jgi:hypothetical protein
MVAENLLQDGAQQTQGNNSTANEFMYFAYGSNLLKERIHVQV